MLPECRSYWRQRALHRHGQPATATVVAVAVSSDCQEDVLHLRFTTRDGVVVAWPAAAYVVANHYFVGDMLPLRYLPRHPRRCLLLEKVYSNQPCDILWFYAGCLGLFVVSALLG